jgi:hypothetical protein
MTSRIRSVFIYRPYNFFLLTSALLLLGSVFIPGQTLDMHLHDTYYVFPAVYLFWTIALAFLLAWTVYKLTNRFLLTKFLTWFHIVTTLIFLIILMIANLWRDNPIPSNGEPLAFGKFFESQQRTNTIMAIISILFLAGQIGYFINLIAGLFRRR